MPALSSVEPGLAQYNILDPSHQFTFNITAAVSNDYSLCKRVKKTHTAFLKCYYANPRLFIHVAPDIPAARHLKSHFCPPRPATRQHESENGLLNHRPTRPDRGSGTLCNILSHHRAEHDLAAAVWRQY